MLTRTGLWAELVWIAFAIVQTPVTYEAGSKETAKQTKYWVVTGRAGQRRPRAPQGLTADITRAESRRSGRVGRKRGRQGLKPGLEV